MHQTCTQPAACNKCTQHAASLHQAVKHSACFICALYLFVTCQQSRPTWPLRSVPVHIYMLLYSWYHVEYLRTRDFAHSRDFHTSEIPRTESEWNQAQRTAQHTCTILSTQYRQVFSPRQVHALSSPGPNSRPGPKSRPPIAAEGTPPADLGTVTENEGHVRGNAVEEGNARGGRAGPCGGRDVCA